MKIYFFVAGALLGLGVCLSGAAPVLAQDVSSSTNDAAAQLISKFDEQRNVIRKSAPVHSQAQLAEYLTKAKESDSPLNLLSPQARARFVDSLKFNERGVTSFYYADIESELSSGQAYDLLFVFGLQDTLHFMRNIRVSNDRDREVMRAFGTQAGIDQAPREEHESYECVGRGTCHESVGSICTNNC